ncbi:MAG: hypothetical protein LBK71_09155 [Verrucomicrobiales bacterium]|jgi:type II secretory pathway pseudopilin PulG|nr:hypothetical protein [Verrucomicrobiales bacterium]
MKPTAQRRPGRAGFTLVEMLVAETVFLLLLVLVMQVVFTVTKISTDQKQQADALAVARQALDRMQLDWMARVRRADVTADFYKTTGNDSLGLLCQMRAYDGSRASLSAVAYRINPERAVGGQTDWQVFERGVTGFDWEGAEALTLPLHMADWRDRFTADDYEILARNVFRLELSFLQKVRDPADSPYTADEDNALNLNSAELVAVVVTVAVLNEQGRKIATQQHLTELVQALPDAANARDTLTVWTEQLNSPAFAPDVPLRVKAGIRVYQRVFYVSE